MVFGIWTPKKANESRFLFEQRTPARVSELAWNPSSSLNMCIKNAITNVALNAPHTSTIIPQYMTKFAIDQVCDKPGVNVSMTV